MADQSLLSDLLRRMAAPRIALMALALACTARPASAADCNTNGTPDDLDISGRSSEDCNSNGVPDECDTFHLNLQAAGDVPKYIPDNVPVGVNSILNVSSTSAVTDVNVRLTIAHTWVGDLVVKLAHASTATLVNRAGGTQNSGHNFTNTVFDDSASLAITAITQAGAPYSHTYRPTSPLTVFNGANQNGVWTLNVRDASAFATGTLLAWGLFLSSAAAVPDCNTNGVPDSCEMSNRDCNTNGMLDDCESGVDCDSNGVPDFCQPGDCNTNHTLDLCDVIAGAIDCDSNHTPDVCEPDCNTNNRADPCDLLIGTAADCDRNGLLDICDLAIGDCNTNGLVDRCELPDCNTNGRPDICDLAPPHDADRDGIPDECERPPCSTCAGDLNLDNRVDAADIAGWIRCAMGSALPGDQCACADAMSPAQFVARLLSDTNVACHP